MLSGPRGRRRLRWIALGGVLLLLVAGAAAAVVLTSKPGDVSNPDVAFTDERPSAPPPTHEPTATEHPMDDGFNWPVYGYTERRTRALGTRAPLRPPFVTQWAVTGRVLLEFPPVLCKRWLYLLKNNGALYQVTRLSGWVRWKVKLGHLAAASPACDADSVYAVILERGRGVRAGRIVALDARDGRTRWSRPLPARSESSPLLVGGRLYFGTEDGTVYALDARDGSVRWTAKAEGAIKGGLALAGDKLVFGDYGGKVHALRIADGRRVWRSSSAGGSLGLRTGRFYSTPAVAYGRVYIGSLDGFVYSFAADSGKLAWRHRTGGYVYGSPTVETVPGVGPTVYVGSYDGFLYAFDARSGRVRWRHDAGGKISGAAVVIGDLVFYSNLARRSTAAVGAATGRTVWSTGRGAFNPAISDGKRLYFVGYSSLFMLSDAFQARRDERARDRIAEASGHAKERAARKLAKRYSQRLRARRRAMVERVKARLLAERRKRRAQRG